MFHSFHLELLAYSFALFHFVISNPSLNYQSMPGTKLNSQWIVPV